MAREFSVIVGIQAGPARRGAREFKAASDTVVRGSNRMNRSLKATNRRAVALITTIGRIRGVATLAFSGFLGVGGLTAVTRTLSQFQTEISRVTALVSAQNPNSLGGAMGALTERARELGATTIFTATQAAEGMRFLTLAGFEANEVYTAIGPTLNLAAAGMLDLGTAADITSNIMAAFSLEASEVDGVVDALAFTAARTNTNITQLGQAMKFVGPVAGALGINVEDTAVALGILGNSGLQATLAGTGLRRVMSGILGPSKEAMGVFESLGVTQQQLVETMQGEDGLVRLIELFAEKGLDAADAFTLFGQRGAPAILSLVSQTGKLRELTEAQREAGEVAKEMAEILQDNLGGDARIAISALQEAILQLGDAGLSDWLRSVTQGFTGFIRAVTGMVTPTEDLTAAMEKGIMMGQKFRENWDRIKVGLVFLTAVVFRNLIYTMTVGLVGALFKAGAGVVVLTGQIIGMGASMATARVVALGLWAALAPLAPVLVAVAAAAGVLLYQAFKDSSEETENLAEELDLLREEADKLVFVFDKVGEARQRLAIQKLSESITKDAEELRSLEQDLQSITPKFFALASAEADLKRLTEETNAARAAGDPSYAQLASRLVTQQTLVNGLREQYEGLNRVELEARIEELNERIREGESDLIGMSLVLQGVYDSLEDYRQGANDAEDATEKLNRELRELTGLDADEMDLFSELIDDALPARAAIAEVQEQMDLFQQVLDAGDAALEKLGLTSDDVAKIQRFLAHEMEEATEQMNSQEEAAEALADGAQKILDRLDPISKLTRTLELESALLTAEWEAQVEKTFDLEEALRKLREEYDENIKKLQDTCEQSRKTAECQSEAAKRIQSIWDQAMRNVQDVFADAFRGAFKSSSEFFDRIEDAFKDMIANMLAAWFSSGIMNILGGQAWGTGGNTLGTIFSVFGGSGTGSGAGGTASSGGGIFAQGGQFIAGLGKSITAAFKGSALYSALVGFAKSAAVGAKLFLSSGYSGAQIATGGSFGATAGAVGVGAGIGALTGTIANQVFGGRGDPTRNAIFSTIGGAIGAYFGGPPGAVIGGAIGSFVDNLIGGAKKLESAVLELDFQSGELRAQTETVVSTQRSFFRGRKFKTTTKDVTDRFAEVEGVINSFFEELIFSAEALGATVDGLLENFEFNAIINTKGKSEASIAASIEAFITNVMTAGIDAFLETVEGLEPYIEATLQTVAQGLVEGLTTNVDQAIEDAQNAVENNDFGSGIGGLIQRLLAQQIAAGGDGSNFTTLEQRQDQVESFVAALQSLVKITGLLGADLVDIVTEIEEAAGRSSIENYRLALDTYRELLASYEGGVPALIELAEATQVVTEVQVSLIAAYRQLGRELSELFQGSAQTVREALLNEEELYNLRRSQIDALVEQAQNTTDPEKLRALAEEINRLGLDAFNLLDEGQQGELGQEFIDFFEGLDELFGDQIMAGIGSIQDDQAALNQEVADRLLEVAQAQLDAANAGRDLFDDWRDWFDRERGGGGDRNTRDGDRIRELIA